MNTHKTMLKGKDLSLDVCDKGHSVSIVTFEPRNQYLTLGKKHSFSLGFGKGRFLPKGLMSL
ncbi:hypothetical protein ACT3TY_10990 [Halomonas sp. AOP22-C1-8]|uniref:hypothetical protein n=1 Tax=Halomonas sp. AOP22-C1-8 TaxID=3457717 RepID=UPI004034AA7F